MIIGGTCYSYKKEILQGKHQTTDTYMLALFTSSASIGPSTTSYSGQAGEASGTGYVAGGSALSGFSVGLTGGVAFVDFSDLAFDPATITARGALVYNASRGNSAVGVIDFGSDVTSTNGPFTVRFPANDADHAWIALT
jgi:hypothetical protein